MTWLTRWLRGPHGKGGDGPALEIDVRCDRCGELITVRVDPRYELRADQQDGREVRLLDKDVLGTRCFALLHVHAVFDLDLTLRAQQVTGGELVALRRAPAR